MTNLINADEISCRLARVHRYIFGFCMTCLLLLPAMVLAEVVGKVTHLGGVLRATHSDGVSRLLSVKSEIMEGDTLKTEENTYARIKFIDGGEIVLRPETVLKVDTYVFKTVSSPENKDSIVLNLAKGGLRSVTGLLGKRSPNAFQLKTETATIGIRGTHLGALLCNFDYDCANIPTVSGKPPEIGLHTDTAQGTIIISNKAGSIESPAGTFSYTPGFNIAPRLVPPSQGIQVTMPPSISSNKASGKGMGSNDGNACKVD